MAAASSRRASDVDLDVARFLGYAMINLGLQWFIRLYASQRILLPGRPCRS